MISLRKNVLYLICWWLAIGSAFAQETQPITLQDVFRSGKFSQRSVYGINWMNDGRYYTSQDYDRSSGALSLVKYDITTSEAVETLLNSSEIVLNGNTRNLRWDSYELTTDEAAALIMTNRESIYRRSYKAEYYLVDLTTNEAQTIGNAGEKISYATLAPNGAAVAYTQDNDLYYHDLGSNQQVQVTNTGEWNRIINGSADWVYEEEFSMAQAFAWSPDGSQIAYWTFDETEVPEFNMQLWGELYPEDYRFKYPKAGETNSTVTISVYDMASKQSVTMDIGSETDIYIPRIYWVDNETLSIIRMNRLQNELEILHANTKTGRTQVILKETADTYVDIDYNDNLQYLADGTFIRTSEQDGYKHIYHYKNDGTLIKQITSGEWEVTELVGIDTDKKLIYFMSAEQSPLERHLYSIRMNGKKKTLLSEGEGNFRVNMSSDFSYYIQYFNSPSTPNLVTLHEAPSGKQLQVLEDNAALKETVGQYTMGTKEYITVPTENGDLNAWVIKPADFDPSKKYPLLMYVYGGPGSQTVRKTFSSGRELWYHHLANQGYIIASVDNRGTGARGRAFKHKTYAMMGKYEVEDQIAAAKWFGTQGYVDAERIGIWGWSYGGYMSSLSLFVGNDVFKAAIAVAPVTSWRYYDTIYTERYLQRPQDNSEGYDAWSPITHADKLEGNYLLIHGTGDDNVHFQNTVELLNRLIASGKQFDTFYYPNRNHGIYGGNTTIHLYTQMTNWLLENL
ncbi:MAG TPA: S9 family peptidase [Cytophagales bacterium]|nr:S9 family peptidase [Cytophagales bacterium]HAA18423.1 S9 family peptidase [Cytophagales bacterium]HAP61469.1 S9 family peptidase [Cytophagales bacterium]